MIDRKIIKFLLRRGTDAERQQVVFETGEMVYTTDTKRLFIGDSEQIGGNPVSTPIRIANGLPLNPDLSDTVYDTITHDTFIYTVSGFKPLTNLNSILSGAALNTVSTTVTASSKFLTFTNSGVNYGIRLWEI